MTKPRILVVDDEPDMRWVIRGVFEGADFEIAEAGNGREALAVLEEFNPDVVLTDIVMPEMDGQELLNECQQIDRDLPVILISAVEDIDVAVRAMKDGAFDYMAKPFDSERLQVTVARAAEQFRLRREVASLKGQLQDQARSFGDSQPAQDLERTLDLIAGQGALSVMLVGESGTGKEVAAREIHRRSEFHGGPFVAVDCGALPEQLMESQLFGHKKGAFTGADRDRPGLFRMAEGGTLFLDELGNLPLNLQAKLLRSLQERVVVPVGGSEPVPFNTRLVAATNSNLLAAVDAGEFRLDLYHRICEFTIEMPPLRTRPDDIAHFARLFLTEANREMGRDVETITETALEAMRGYSWPGNLRELRNVTRRGIVVCNGRELDVGDLNMAPERGVQPDMETPHEHLPLRERVRQATDSLEAHIIQQALTEAEGNKAAAARALQIDYTTLHRKLKKHGLLPMAPQP